MTSKSACSAALPLILLALLAGCGGSDQSSSPQVQNTVTMSQSAVRALDVLPPGMEQDAVFHGKLADYTIVRDGAVYVVTEKAGAKTVRNVEFASRLLFDDATVGTAVSVVPARVYRLYQAALGRTPDPAGLGFHIAAMEGAGASLEQVSEGFINSPEFSTLYGALDNNKFLVQLYANVLHRAADSAGLAYWLNLLDSKALTRAQVLAGFSESKENMDAVAPAIVNGITFIPYIVPGSATAATVRPEYSKVAWRADSALDIILRDSRGTPVPGGQISCKPVDPALLTISADCRTGQGQRLGQVEVAVTGAGLSAKVALTVIPQRKPFGTAGNARHFNVVATGLGGALAWGYNSNDNAGQGLPRLDSYNLPQQVKDAAGTGYLSNVAATAAGELDAMALLESGEVVGWTSGYTFARQGALKGLPLYVRNPANDGNLRGIVQLSLGQLNAVGLTDEGKVMTWGNYNGQGVSGTANFPNLVKSAANAPLSDIVSVAAGGDFGIALTASGKVWGWGWNSSGETGRGFKGEPQVFAAPVLGPDGTELSNIVAISAGYRFSLALTADGKVYGWGDNDWGQLGQNNAEGEAVKAVLVKDSTGTGVLSNIVMVSAGGNHALALDSAGRVLSWGYESNGELGEGANRQRVAPLRPGYVIGSDGTGVLDGIVSITTSYQNSLALRADGTVFIWGRGFGGNLGQGTASTAETAVPTAVKNVGGSGRLLLLPSRFHNLLNRGR